MNCFKLTLFLDHRVGLAGSIRMLDNWQLAFKMERVNGTKMITKEHKVAVSALVEVTAVVRPHHIPQVEPQIMWLVEAMPEERLVLLMVMVTQPL